MPPAGAAPLSVSVVSANAASSNTSPSLSPYYEQSPSGSSYVQQHHHQHQHQHQHQQHHHASHRRSASGPYAFGSRDSQPSTPYTDPSSPGSGLYVNSSGARNGGKHHSGIPRSQPGHRRRKSSSSSNSSRNLSVELRESELKAIHDSEGPTAPEPLIHHDIHHHGSYGGSSAGNNSSGSGGGAQSQQLSPSLNSGDVLSHVDKVAVLAKSQAGSRHLQQRIAQGDANYFSFVFSEVYEHLPELMVDLFGNYLCQKLIAFATEKQRHAIIQKIAPHIVNISCDRQGTRAVQKLVEAAVTDIERRMLVDAICNTASPSFSSSSSSASSSAASTPVNATSPSTQFTANLSALLPSPSASSNGTPAPSAAGVVTADITSNNSNTSSNVSNGTAAAVGVASNPVDPSSSSDISAAASSVSAMPSSAAALTASNTSKKSRTHILQLIRDPNGSHVIHAMLDRFPLQMLSTISDVAFRAACELAVDQHGLCVLKKCMTLSQPNDFIRLSQRIIQHVLEFVNNQYGNYLVQHLIEHANFLQPSSTPGGGSSGINNTPDHSNSKTSNAATAEIQYKQAQHDVKTRQLFSQLNTQLHQALKTHYARLSRQKFSSNVVEKCLRVPDKQWRAEIIAELMTEGTISSLLQDSYGNYVMQHVLYVADREQAKALISRIRPELSTLRKNIRKKWERLLASSTALGGNGSEEPWSANSSAALGGPGPFRPDEEDGRNGSDDDGVESGGFNSSGSGNGNYYNSNSKPNSHSKYTNNTSNGQSNSNNSNNSYYPAPPHSGSRSMTSNSPANGSAGNSHNHSHGHGHHSNSHAHHSHSHGRSRPSHARTASHPTLSVSLNTLPASTNSGSVAIQQPQPQPQQQQQKQMQPQQPSLQHQQLPQQYQPMPQQYGYNGKPQMQSYTPQPAGRSLRYPQPSMMQQQAQVQQQSLYPPGVVQYLNYPQQHAASAAYPYQQQHYQVQLQHQQVMSAQQTAAWQMRVPVAGNFRPNYPAYHPQAYNPQHRRSSSAVHY